MRNVLLGLTLFVLMSCRTTRYVPVETIRTDTLYVSKNVRDSIWLHDSIHIREFVAGDTIYSVVTKTKTKYIERTTHDTLYVSTHDTIPEPYPVEVEVEKHLSWWQATRIHVGSAALALLALWAGWKVLRLYIRRKVNLG